MKQRITPSLIGITTLLLVVCSCDMTENRIGCPTVGEVELSFDWAQVPDGAGSPNDMSVHFYHEDGSVVSGKTGDGGGDFPLKRGHYSLLVFNEDGVAVTLKTDENQLENNLVSVIEVAPPAVAGESGSYAAEPYIGQPRTLYSVADISPDFFVEVGEKVEKTVQPENHIRQARIVANMQGDFAEVTACTFELTGLVQSLNLSNYSFEGIPTTTSSEAVRTATGYSRLLTLLGKHPAATNLLRVHVDCRSGMHYDFAIDVSQALAEVNTPGIFSATITLDILVLDKHELGFVVELVDWEYVSGGNLDVSFNE